MIFRPRCAISVVFSILLVGCGGTQFVQPELAGEPPQNLAKIEAIKWSSGQSGLGEFSASIARVWDSKGKKLFDAPGERRSSVTLKPGAYEFLVVCEAAGKVFSPPRLGIRLAASQEYSVHCEPGTGSPMRVVTTQTSGLPPPRLK